MPDSSSSDNALPPEAAGAVPKSWIHYEEVSKPKQRRRVSNGDCVIIKKSRLNIPMKVWEQLGKPAKVTCYFHGQDTILTPSSEIRLKFGKTWAFVTFEDKAKLFRPYILPGIYRKDQYRVESIGDLKYLRIKESTFTSINHKWLQHWTQTD